ncbi:hypothetical protein RIN66_04055 [Hafnia alvei]|uniref:hypothetical protein n=1 Tax=Hafnia alvei TaxID=569 RepID=UPI0028BDE97E|nr:hypothetical protein [Hafnia alvei]WNN53244.1 hypothetical protein RIN66_04055 [Hafnia alvei]
MVAQRDQFVELGRTFHELAKESADHEEVLTDYWDAEEALNWEKLLNERRVVILSEAGSGKTTEIYSVANRLRKEGKNAFFLRLEHIPSGLESPFEVGSYDEFLVWIASDEEGWVFLDSVDESRLGGPHDFERAIRLLASRISNVLHRSHVIITSRQSAWRAKDDLVFCKERFPYVEHPSFIKNNEDELSTITLLPDQQISKNENKEDLFKIVALADLNSDQVSHFIQARGIKINSYFLMPSNELMHGCLPLDRKISKN